MCYLILLYIYTGYYDDGDPQYKCGHCNGKVQLPKVRNPPTLLNNLLHGNNEKGKHFRDHIRSYNNMFAFTSLGGEIDYSLNTGNSPPVFRLNGQNYHLIGSLLPNQNSKPQFAQLYIYDTQNEIANRMRAVR